MAPRDDAAIMRTVEALQARNIHVMVTDTHEEANNALIQLLPEGAEICDSTSETLDAIGFTAFVRGNPRYKNLHDVYEAEPDMAKRNDLRRRASIADYFIGSAQAIAETGEIFVASATGSQLYAVNTGDLQGMGRIEGEQIIPMKEHHRFKRFAALELSKDAGE